MSLEKDAVKEKLYDSQPNIPPPAYSDVFDLSKPTEPLNPPPTVQQKRHHCCMGRRIAMGMAGPQCTLGHYIRNKIKGSKGCKSTEKK